MEGCLTFFDLPQQDIIFDQIFIYFYLDEIYKYRRISHSFKKLCEKYFETCSVFDISRFSSNITLSSELLERLTKNNFSLHSLILQNPRFLLEDSIVIDILKQNTNLKKLNLTDCRMLTSVVISKLAECCSQLREVILYNCIWVAPRALADVFKNCHHLEKVDLTSCSRMDGDCVSSLAENCPKLTFLRLNKVIAFDVDIDKIAAHCSALTHVGLSGCFLLTDSCLETLVFNCPNLKFVEVHQCKMMTKKGLQLLWSRNIKTDVSKEFVEKSKFWS